MASGASLTAISCFNCCTNESQLFYCSKRHFYCKTCLENSNVTGISPQSAFSNRCPRCNDTCIYTLVQPEPLTLSVNNCNTNSIQHFNDSKSNCVAINNSITSFEVPSINHVPCTKCNHNNSEYTCQPCENSFCVSCLSNHFDICISKTHQNSFYQNRRVPLVPAIPRNGRNRKYCNFHNLVCQKFCKTCSNIYCIQCIAEDHYNHAYVNLETVINECKSSNNHVLKTCNDFNKDLNKMSDSLSATKEKVNQNHNESVQSINEFYSRVITTIEEERENTLMKLKAIKIKKIESIDEQMGMIESAQEAFCTLFEVWKTSLNDGSIVDVVQNQNRIFQLFSKVKSTSLFVPAENAYIELKISPNISKQVRNFVHISSSAYGPLSNVLTEVVDTISVNICSSFTVQAVDHIEQLITHGNDEINVLIEGPNLVRVPANVINHGNGTFSVNYILQVEGIHNIYVSFHGKQIIGSPFKVNSRAVRDFSLPSTVTVNASFGSEGNADNNFCRPWGLCCGFKGRLVVGDRSNNKIKIYHNTGSFYKAFGSEGSEDGQFNRPAGVACDKYGRIIVADKDNHRIQVFDKEGEFLFKFGEKGTKCGQFVYPWDVDVNSKCQIIVSDTRNRRIQLFDVDGKYIDKYVMDCAHAKVIESPRGVAFTHDGDILVTDFNNHRIIRVNKDLHTSEELGKNFLSPPELQRPQGIATNGSGNIVVSDSKNQRILVLDKNGNVLKRIGGTRGSSVGQFDRPSGICITRDNLIAVVDFGNHRVQIF